MPHGNALVLRAMLAHSGHDDVQVDLAMTARPRSALYLLLQELAARPQGVGTAEAKAHGYTLAEFCHAFLAGVKHKRLFSVRLGSKFSTYFTSREAADRARAVFYRPSKPFGTAPVRSRPPWPANAETIYPTNPDGSPAYKVTVCPSTLAGHVLKTDTHRQL